MLILLAAAASGLIALGLVVGFLTFMADDDGGGGGSAGEARAALTAAGCTLREVPAAKSATHVERDAKPKWNTDPPTNGPHYGGTIVYGIYDEPVPQIEIVHNLEHGAVYVQYGDDVPDATVTQLEEYYRDDPQGLIVAPYPKLGDKIALGAWNEPKEGEDDVEKKGYLARCPRFDENAFDKFRDAFQYKGPERFPPEELRPGGP